MGRPVTTSLVSVAEEAPMALVKYSVQEVFQLVLQTIAQLLEVKPVVQVTPLRSMRRLAVV